MVNIINTSFIKIRLSVPILSLFLLSFINTVNADIFSPTELKTSQMDFGGTGLMQMPSGRMAPDGDFNVGGTFNNEYNHGFVSLQVLPWAQATIRYTMVSDVLYSSSYSFSGDNEYTDKGLDFKFQLLEESNWLPETSIGLRDIGGTGLFDGEFIAATKRFGGLDFTLGIGWGYLGTSNNITSPFCKVSNDYCTRDNSYSGTGGGIDYARWFTGPSAIFGGIEYQTPYEPLVLKLEYDSNNYSDDYPVKRNAADMTQHTPWNFGLLYALNDWANLRVSYERGDTLTLGFTFHSDFNKIKSSWRDTPTTVYASPSSNLTDWNQVASKIKHEAGYKYPQIIKSDKNITVMGEQTKYRDLDIAHKRAGTLLSQVRSKNIETYTFIETKQGLDITETQFNADKFDKVINNSYIGANINDAKKEKLRTKPSSTKELLAMDYDKFSYTLEPTLTQTFGSAETFDFYAIGATAKSAYQLNHKLILTGSLYFNATDNYDEFNYVTYNPGIKNFSTPRVRTLFRYYVHDHPVRMNNLQLTWFDKLSDDLYFQAYGGYLESMFAGVGSEVLYRPTNSRWAIGADINFISQRDPDNWFSTYSKDYFGFGDCSDGITTDCAAYVLSSGKTGFLNIYYQPDFPLLKNTLIKAHIGQFLGQDKGIRLDISKQFDSGIITGVYASFSDLTADEYGEGSFTKGFYISVPFDLMTVKPSRSRAAMAWQPITRDGGQMLGKRYNLFSVTDGRSPWFTKPASN